MWSEILRYMPEFETAVLTGFDETGRPFSLRCRPQPDGEARVLRILLPEEVGLLPGRAGLLFHRHDENLWSLLSFILRGELARDGKAWIFRPEKFVPGMGVGGLQSYVRFVLKGRKAAKQYLEQRGLPRPQIPWDEWMAVFKEAKSR